MGVPDMRIPIQYALTYPRRVPSPVRQLQLEEFGSLTFAKPDETTFGCIGLCRNAIREGGLRPAAVNSANEAANALFREGKIRFLEIEERVAKASAEAPSVSRFTLDDVLATDEEMRRLVSER